MVQFAQEVFESAQYRTESAVLKRLESDDIAVIGVLGDGDFLRNVEYCRSFFDNLFGQALIHERYVKGGAVTSFFIKGPIGVNSSS